MTQEERNKVYEGFTMIDVMAKNIIREAEGLLDYAKEHGIVPHTLYDPSLQTIIKTAKDMEHRKETYFTWLNEMKKEDKG